MKAFFKVIPVIFVVAILAGCSMGAETAMATIVVDVDQAETAKAVNLGEVSHSVALSGPTGGRSAEIGPGGGSVSFTVAPGTWNISVTGYYRGQVYSTGTATADVVAGKTTNVSVPMTVVYVETPSGGGSSTPVDNRPMLQGIVSIWGDYWIGGSIPAEAMFNLLPSVLFPELDDPRFTVQWYIDGTLVQTDVNVPFQFGSSLGGSGFATNAIPLNHTFSEASDWNKDMQVVVSHPDFKGSVSKTIKICKGIKDSTDWANFSIHSTGWDWNGNSFILVDNPTVAAPLGSDTDKFNGYFDGNGYMVTLAMPSTSDDYAGLFACNAGIVKNVIIEGTIIHPSYLFICYIGGVAGLNEGTIMNSSYDDLTATFSGDNYGEIFVGGIAGKNTGTIKNCFVNSKKFEAINTMSTYAGGIAGVNEGSISYCWVIAGTGSDGIYAREGGAGGIAGKNDAAIANCVVLGGFIQQTNASACVGRIWGTGTGAGTANYAAVNKVDTVDFGGPYTPVGDSTLKDGADVGYQVGSPPYPPTDAASEEWWSGTSGVWKPVFDESDAPLDESKPWRWLSYDRPFLRQYP